MFRLFLQELYKEIAVFNILLTQINTIAHEIKGAIQAHRIRKDDLL